MSVTVKREFTEEAGNISDPAERADFDRLSGGGGCGGEADEDDGRALRVQLQVTSYKLQVTSYKLQVASCKLQVTSYKLQVASYKLRAPPSCSGRLAPTSY